MHRTTAALSALLSAMLLPAVAHAQRIVPVAAAPAPASYAEVADLAVEAATIIDARIRRASPVPADQAIGIPAHLVRFYVEAEVNGLLYGSDAVARRVGYLVDQPRLANGRAPRLRGNRVLLFARPVVQSNRLQLVNPGAQLPWNSGREAHARAIAAELVRGAPPRVTGIAQAFHVPGTVAGESETQIFLATASGDPVSLTVLRRPGADPVWAAAFGEIVDEAAGAPARGTLGWYRLACGLPASLPAAATAALAPAEARAAAADYAIVLRDVGACDRGVAGTVVGTPR